MDILTIVLWLVAIALVCLLMPYIFAGLVIAFSVIVTALTLIWKGFTGVFKLFKKA